MHAAPLVGGRAGSHHAADATARTAAVQHAIDLKAKDDRIASLKTEKASLQTENKSLKTEKASLQTENKSLKTETASLQANNVNLERVRAKESARNQAKDKEITELKTKAAITHDTPAPSSNFAAWRRRRDLGECASTAAATRPPAPPAAAPAISLTAASQLVEVA